MTKKFAIILLTVYLCSCATEEKQFPQNSDSTFDITIINKIPFDIEILDEKRLVPHGGEKKITLPRYTGELNDGYGITYHINLAGKVLIKIRRNENIIIKPDNNTFVIDDYQFDTKESYLILKNESKQTISVKNGSEYINPIIQAAASEKKFGTPYLEAGGENVYSLGIMPVSLVVEADQYKTTPLSMARFSPSFLYAFTFDGSTVSLTDSRPLVKIGEAGWTKIIDSCDPLQIVAGADGVTALPSGKFTVTRAMRTAGGAVFISGYQYISDSENAPVLQLQDDNGALVHSLAASTNADRRQAYFSDAAKDDDKTYLAAGGADSGLNSADAYIAYVRAIRDDTSRLMPRWELGPVEFNQFCAQNNISEKCGAANSVTYNLKRKCWLLIGNTIEYDALKNPVKGSYLAEIADVDGSGVIQKIDTSFKDISFYKIVSGENGASYLAGEEEKADGVYAIVIKYDAAGKEIWRQKNQPRNNSFYNDAALDTENGQLVLAGTMNAKTESGAGGTPFIEGVSIDNGALLWREELNTKPFSGTSLVTGIGNAPDYGFVLSLCGIANDYYSTPFMLARVNVRGKIINTHNQTEVTK
jgi:hypothetical protein